MDHQFVINKLLDNDVAYIPQNDKSIIENVLRTNIFRVDTIILHNLSYLFKNLLIKSQYTEKTADIIDRLFDEIDEKLRNFDFQENGGVPNSINLKKAHLFT